MLTAYFSTTSNNKVLIALLMTCLVILVIEKYNESIKRGQLNKLIRKRSSIPKDKIIPFFSSLAAIEPPEPVDTSCQPPSLLPM